MWISKDFRKITLHKLFISGSVFIRFYWVFQVNLKARVKYGKGKETDGAAYEWFHDSPSDVSNISVSDNLEQQLTYFGLKSLGS